MLQESSGIQEQYGAIHWLLAHGNQMEPTLRFRVHRTCSRGTGGTLRPGDRKGLPYSSWQMLFPHSCQGSEHLSCLSFFSYLYPCQAWPRAPGFMTSFSPTGRSRLAPPRNVTLLSQNFTVYLTWLPGLGSPPNVTYFVTYQRYSGAFVLAGGERKGWMRNGEPSLGCLHSMWSAFRSSLGHWKGCGESLRRGFFLIHFTT